MVTFICEYCDVTLKKKQCDSHVLGRCRPGALICIDCSKTFRGMDYKQHISCISEMDKHWGQFAPSKKNNNNQQVNTTQPKEEKQQEKKDEQKTQEKIEGKETNWKGWKNQIKTAIVQESPQERKVDLESLKKKVLKRYHEQFASTDKDEQVFLEKLQKLKKVKMTTYVQLN